jgi:ligand-binding sensor domain-containing protein
MWFSTNQGVSRFDGHSFRNFTKEDGLPDNEIIKMYLDKHNSVWFISMLGIPSVYTDGKITLLNDCKDITAITENFENDSIYLISAIGATYGYYSGLNVKGNRKFVENIRTCTEKDTSCVINFPILKAAEEGGTNFYFSIEKYEHIKLTVEHKGQLNNMHFQVRGPMNLYPFLYHSYHNLSPDKKTILFYTNDSIYSCSLNKSSRILSLRNLGINVNAPSQIVSMFYESENTIWLCTRNRGLMRINNFRSVNRSVDIFFNKSFCTSLVKDLEGGLWVSSHDDGVFYIPDERFKHITDENNLGVKDVRSIKKMDDHTVAAGFGDGNLITINEETLDISSWPAWSKYNKNNRILDIAPFRGHSMLLSTDAGVFEYRPWHSWKNRLSTAVKSVYIKNNTTIVTATAEGSIKLNGDWEAKMFFPVRCITVSGKGAKYYLGTLHGAYVCDDTTIRYLGDTYHELSNIINHINIAPDSSIWFSTPKGIIVMRDKKLHYINKLNGLASNLCKHISFDPQTAWASTDKGITRIDYEWKGSSLHYSIWNISDYDGLASNDVNQTTVSDKYVWAATTSGISFFTKAFQPSPRRKPLMNVNRVWLDSKELPAADTVFIERNASQLLVELSPISYRSGRLISSQYRLAGIEKAWKKISGNTLQLSNLPFGNYRIEIRSIDRWGGVSESAKVYISHPAPFWKTTWFTILSYILTGLLIGSIVYIYNRNRQRKIDEKEAIKRKIFDLEVMALRAQMNPHFIFNCLSSIQHHILKAEPVKANLYLHKLSTLMRSMLQNSTSPAISLAEEIAMLSLYLELEKLRLEERLRYVLDYPEHLLLEPVRIPSMIIQPFIENAIKHGISPLKNEVGVVIVSFKKSANRIDCTIDDNGIGIKHSGNNTAQGGSYHKSLGRTITEKRIQTINTVIKEPVILSITDKHDLTPPSRGTIVQISFPIASEI